MVTLLSRIFIRNREHTDDAKVTGVVMALDNVLAIFLLPIFGSISDKVDTKLGPVGCQIRHKRHRRRAVKPHGYQHAEQGAHKRQEKDDYGRCAADGSLLSCRCFCQGIHAGD